MINKHNAAINAVAVAVAIRDRLTSSVWTSQDKWTLPCQIKNVIVVATSATINGIACAADDQVGIRTAIDDVGTGIAGQRVIATFTKDGIVAVTA